MSRRHNDNFDLILVFSCAILVLSYCSLTICLTFFFKHNNSPYNRTQKSKKKERILDIKILKSI